MALHQISLSSPSSMRMLMRSSTPTPTDYSRLSATPITMVRDGCCLTKKRVGGRRSRGGFCVRSSLEMAGPVVGQVTEVGQDTFWPLVNAAGDKVVVLDMYTQWCGPCKVMAPKYEELSKEHLDVVFLKLDCNQDNKALAKELGIRVVPTFKILKDSKVIKEVTGAKLDDLIAAIKTAKSS